MAMLSSTDRLRNKNAGAYRAAQPARAEANKSRRHRPQLCQNWWIRVARKATAVLFGDVPDMADGVPEGAGHRRGRRKMLSKGQ